VKKQQIQSNEFSQICYAIYAKDVTRNNKLSLMCSAGLKQMRAFQREKTFFEWFAFSVEKASQKKLQRGINS
jgi:hypothetical protein